MRIKPIEECHRIVKYEQERRQIREQAIEAVKDTMPSKAQTKYNQRDIEKRSRKVDSSWIRGGINE